MKDDKIKGNMKILVKPKHAETLSFLFFRMTSSCSVGNWSPAGGTWQTSCGCSTCPVERGSGGTPWSARWPRLRSTRWRGTRPTASCWRAVMPSCWSSLATPPSTATSATCRSTTWVSHSFCRHLSPAPHDICYRFSKWGNTACWLWLLIELHFELISDLKRNSHKLQMIMLRYRVCPVYIDIWMKSVLTAPLFIPSCQDPTRGWYLRPKGRFHKEVTVTAARLTAPVAACTSTEATRPCLSTNTALLTTSTATMLTLGHGKSTHRLFCCLSSCCTPVCVYTTACRVLVGSPLTLLSHVLFQVHPERERFSTIPALGCAPQRHTALLRWQHTQRHVPQQRGQVFLGWLPFLRHR